MQNGFAKSRCKIMASNNLTLRKLPTAFKILPEWQKIVKFGHTTHEILPLLWRVPDQCDSTDEKEKFQIFHSIKKTCKPQR